MGRKVKLILAAIVAVSSIGVAGYLYANHFGVSQFVALKGINQSGNSIGTRIFNPLGLEQYAMAIVYRNNQDLLFCEGELLSPHDTGFIGAPNSTGLIEIISAPTSTPVGRLSHNFGVLAGHGDDDNAGSANGGLGMPILAQLFSTKGPSEADVVDCVCAEICGDLPAASFNFFLNFGIKCPACPS